MAKISTYNLDSSLNDNDKLIGTDGGTGLTKNFSVRTFINYINQQGNVNIVSSVNGLDGDVVLNTDDIPEGVNKYDQEVTITGSGGATVTGLYPNFNISSENDTYIAGDNITINNDNVISSSYQDTTYTAGNNISISQDNVISAIDTNTDTTYTAGNGLSLNGTEFSNDFPDRVVTITGSGDTTVTGEYPNFNVYSDGGVKSIVAGDNITIDPISGTGHITISSTGGGGSTISLQEGNGISINNDDPSAPVITNTAPDQTVTITGSGGAVVTGTYPNFNVDVDVDVAAGEKGVIAKDSFVGNGTQMDYQLSITPTSATYTEVFISGVYQEASTYTLSSDVITFSESPAIDDTIEIVTFNLGAGGNDFITNANDVYPSVSKVTDIISLTQTEYDGLTPDENTIYVIVG